MRIARLTCAVQLGGPKEPLSIVAFDGNAWSAPKVVAGTSVATAPELVRFGETLWCLHQDAETKGNLVGLTFDGSRWTDERVVAAGAMSASPAAVAFNSRLYVFNEGYGNSHTLRFESTAEGSVWTPPAAAPIATHVAGSTAAATFGGLTYVFYNMFGITFSPVAYVTFSAAAVWGAEAVVPSAVALSGFPSAAATFEERLYVAYATANRGIGRASFDGNHWEPGQLVPGTAGQVASGLAAAVFEEQLYVLYRSSANTLAYVRFDGSAWYGPANAGSFSITTEPAAAVF